VDFPYSGNGKKKKKERRKPSKMDFSSCRNCGKDKESIFLQGGRAKRGGKLIPTVDRKKAPRKKGDRDGLGLAVT